MPEQPCLQEQEQKPVQPKKKKKDNPLELIIVLCISAVVISFFPISIIKYSDGARRVITPLTTVIIQSGEGYVTDDGEYRSKPDVDIFLIPNNFKTYDELQQIKEQREAKKP